MAFNREDFSLRSKSELLDYIEQQNEQISRVETRFRDVVRAYRGAIKEKEALEASLNALSQVSESDGGEEGRGGEREGEREGEGDGVEKPAEVGEGERGGEEGEMQSETDDSERDTSISSEKKVSSDAAVVASLRQQLSTLTSSLQTLTIERSKMEANFQRDKKNVLVQQEAMARQHSAMKHQMEDEIQKLQSALEESQASLRSERVSREDEQTTHGDMLRELQSLIATERDGKEALGLQIQDLEKEILLLRSRLNEQKTERDREMDEITQSLALQVENLQAGLKLAEKRLSQPSAELIQLQKEVKRLKEEHAKALLLEQQRSSDAEERLGQQSLREEQQVASLEVKVSQLSETVGSYVLLREQDQSSMQKLRERISQLDVENTQLTRAHVERQEVTTQTAGQVTSLQEKIARLKMFLKIATSRITDKATVPANLEEMTVSEYRDLIGKETPVKSYQQELLQLREEFERYKTRAQNVLRSKDNKDSSTPPVDRKDSMQARLAELQDELHVLQSQKEEDEERHLLQTRKLREEIREMADRNRTELVAMETQHKEKSQDVQRHVQSTRDRTMKLLSEKDSEITHLRGELQALRSQSHTGGLERSLSHISNASSNHQEGLEWRNENGEQESVPSLHQTPSRKHINLSSKSTESITAVQEILEQPSTTPVKEPQLLHFLQEQQRRDNELAAVRRKRFELEDTMRDLQEREQRHLEQSMFLKDQIRKLERDRSRETENMEYVKNIIFHFMCSDSAGRGQMISPITTVLHFSPEEVRIIKEKAAARRWIPRNN